MSYRLTSFSKPAHITVKRLSSRFVWYSLRYQGCRLKQLATFWNITKTKPKSSLSSQQTKIFSRTSSTFLIINFCKVSDSHTSKALHTCMGTVSQKRTEVKVLLSLLFSSIKFLQLYRTWNISFPVYRLKQCATPNCNVSAKRLSPDPGFEIFSCNHWPQDTPIANSSVSSSTLFPSIGMYYSYFQLGKYNLAQQSVFFVEGPSHG